MELLPHSANCPDQPLTQGPEVYVDVSMADICSGKHNVVAEALAELVQKALPFYQAIQTKPQGQGALAQFSIRATWMMAHNKMRYTLEYAPDPLIAMDHSFMDWSAQHV